MTVLSGSGRLTVLDSSVTHTLAPGDMLFVHDQSRVRWEISEDLTKVFFGSKLGGY